MLLPSPAIPVPGLKGNKQAPASTANPGAFEIGSLHFLNLPQSSFIEISTATFFTLLFCGELSSYLPLQLGMKTELLIFKVIHNVNLLISLPACGLGSVRILSLERQIRKCKSEQEVINNFLQILQWLVWQGKASDRSKKMHFQKWLWPLPWE